VNDVKVVDASAIAAILFGEAEAEAIGRRLDNSILLAPELLNFELAQVSIKKLRGEEIEMQDVADAFKTLETLLIDRLVVDPPTVVALAQKAGLSAYDASYLWLSRQHDAELVTLDKKLNTAFLSPIGR